MPPIADTLLDDIIETARGWNPGDAMSPRALRQIAELSRGAAWHASVETGAGGSTMLFSHLSEHHTAFAIEGPNATLSRLRASHLLRPGVVELVDGPTQLTLPRYPFAPGQNLDAVLIDGPHAFPFPHLEYYYLYPHISEGGLLIVDDIHIPTVRDLYRFLSSDDMFDRVAVVGTTAFFRRTEAPLMDPLGDGWWLQGANAAMLKRRHVIRQVKARIPGRLQSTLRAARDLIRTGSLAAAGEQFRFDKPRQNEIVPGLLKIQGTGRLPAGASAWLFARRIDVEGWWPQGGESIRMQGQCWEHPCKLGEAADAGWLFEIAVVVPDEVGTRSIHRWLQECRETGQCGSMALPSSLAGFRAARQVVRRA